MDWIRIIAAPLIGAVIGYCTNYIAVRMLFRPLRPVKIGRYTLPFTPGVIPRRQPVLAAALGRAFGRDLVGAKELEEALLSEQMKTLISENIAGAIGEIMNSEQPVRDLLGEYMGTTAYEAGKEELTSYFTDKIAGGIEQIDVGGLIVEQGSDVLKEKMQGTMMAMFLTDDLIASLAGPIGEKVSEYIRLDGREEISGFVTAEIERLEQKEVAELMANRGDSQVLGERISEIYEDFIKAKGTEITQAVDLTRIVEDKVNAMPAEGLEKLVLSVMEKELGMVIRLGALIGFVIGLLNLLL